MFRLTLAILLIPALGAAAQEKNEIKTELKKFEGTWKIKSFDLTGKKESVPAEEREKIRLTFAGEKLSFKGTPQRDRETTIELDPSKKPPHITIRPPKDEAKGETILGIYRFDKDTLTICGSPKERPTEFALTEGTQNGLLVLERVKETDKKKE